MSILSKPSSAVHVSILFITAGALIDVWSGIWCWYLTMHSPTNDISWFLCWGLILTGLVLVGIGFTLGQIGRAARTAELPPVEVTAAVAQAEKTAAAVAPVLAAAPSPAPVVDAPAAVQLPPDVGNNPGVGSRPLVAAPALAESAHVVPVRHALCQPRSQRAISPE